jgi:hypothetical protein
VVAAEVDEIENSVASYYEVLGINENEAKVLQMLIDSVSEYINLELVWVVDSLTLMSYMR